MVALFLYTTPILQNCRDGSNLSLLWWVFNGNFNESFLQLKLLLHNLKYAAEKKYYFSWKYYFITSYFRIAEILLLLQQYYDNHTYNWLIIFSNLLLGCAYSEIMTTSGDFISHLFSFILLMASFPYRKKLVPILCFIASMVCWQSFLWV